MTADNNQADDSLYTYDSFGSGPSQSKPPSSSFLWWCAGAHQKLLSQFPSEQTKYAGLGGVILATFVLAALASGYAIHSVFGNWLWTIGFAIIWGLIIFNFDRFLVSTMRKYGVSKRKQVMMAIPRLFLALLIGLTIARPLELKIFEKEINTRMVQNLREKVQLNDSLLQRENQLVMQSASNERDRLAHRKTAIEDTLRQLQSGYLQEADGTGGSRQRGIETITRLKLQAYNQSLEQYDPELKKLAADIRYQDSLLANANASMAEKRKEYERTANANQGFLERNKALADLSAEESSVWWTVALVSMLIILIEIGPVLSKLIMPIGPYDIALAREELLQMASDENELRKGKEMVHERRRALYQKQKEMNDELVDKLTRLQKKHIDTELDKWELGEWDPKDHRASMDEVMRKIKKQYQVREDDII
jgi:hypothetical protein